MKTVTITGIMADFLDSIRAYEHESGSAITFDERESSEFVDMYFNNGGKLKIEEEKPLFTTEDGVDIFLGHSYILIDKEFIKHKQTASNIVYTEYFKKFKHESNADEYIWRNKPVFSYNDLRSWDINGGTQEEALKVAKERSKK